MADLPHHVVEEILSRLPVKNLLCFRCVCKAWFHTISHLFFVNLHLHQSVEQDAIKFNVWNSDIMFCLDVKNSNRLQNPIPAVRRDYHFFIGSCDGLIFFLCDTWKNISIMNPSTGAVAFVEQEVYLLADSTLIYRDPISCDYKLLRVDTVSRFYSEVMVYTFSNKTWQKLRNIPYTLWGEGIIFKGSMHWVANSKLFTVILVLHVADYSFSEMTLFNEKRNLDGDRKLTEWENNLCLVCADQSSIVVSMMKEYGNKDSWIKLFVIDNLDIQLYAVFPLHTSVLGKIAFDILFLRNKDMRNGVFLYDEKKQLLEEIKIVLKNPNTGEDRSISDSPYLLIKHVDSLLNPQQILSISR